MKLSECNDIVRGHKSGYHVLVIWEGGMLIRRVTMYIGFFEDEECIVSAEQVRFMPETFFKVASALWSYRKHQIILNGGVIHAIKHDK